MISQCGNATYSSYAAAGKKWYSDGIYASFIHLLDIQENPQTFQKHAQVFLCFRCLYFTEQLQFSEGHSTDLSYSFSTFALINIHEMILEPAFLCSAG